MKLRLKQSMIFLTMALIFIFMTGCSVLPQYATDCMDGNGMDTAALDVSMQPLSICLQSCMENTIPLDRESMEACYYSDCEVQYLTVLEPIAEASVYCIGLNIALPIDILTVEIMYYEMNTRLHTAFRDAYGTAYSNYSATYGTGNNLILEDAYIIISADLAEKLYEGLEDGQGGMVFSGFKELFSSQPFGAATGINLTPIVPIGNLFL